MVRSRVFCLGLSLSAALLPGCASKPAPTPAAPVVKASLYERLGGEAAIGAVVDELLVSAVNDPAVNFTRGGTWQPTVENIRKLKTLLVQQIGEATGGPQKYEGRDMATAHAGMNITEEEWTAFTGHLKGALDRLSVGAAEQEELIAAIVPMKGDIVGK